MIEVRGLTKRYGEKVAVNDLTFGVEPGKFIAQSSGAATRVRTPSPDQLALALAAKGAEASADSDGTLLVRGLTTDAIGDIAFEQGIRVHELSALRASLEEAFMELTADSVEYHAGIPDAPASIGSGV